MGLRCFYSTAAFVVFLCLIASTPWCPCLFSLACRQLLFFSSTKGGTVYPLWLWRQTDAYEPHLKEGSLLNIESLSLCLSPPSLPLQSTHAYTHTRACTHPSWKVAPGYFDCIWLLSSPLLHLSASQPQTQRFRYDFTYRLGKITLSDTMSAKSGVPSSCFGHRRLEEMS